MIPNGTELALDRCLALQRETGCSWAPWNQMYRCWHGMMTSQSVADHVLAGRHMPEIADWLRLNHAGQMAMLEGLSLPEGCGRPFDPQ